MSRTLESTDYDVFDYKHIEERPATLQEAISKASNLRTSDKSHFHRILPVDESLSGFKVVSISKEEVMAEMASKAVRLCARFLGRGWQAKQRHK